MKDDHSLNDNDFNSCRSDYNNREVHLVILYTKPIHPIHDWLPSYKKWRNRKYVEFKFEHDYIDTSYTFYISKDVEVLKFIENLFKEVPWGSSMSQINNTQLISSSGDRRILIKEEIIDPITHFINSGKFQTY